MKKPTAKTPAENQIPAQAGETCRPMKSLEELTNEFGLAQQRKQKSDGSNEVLSDFLLAARMLVSNYAHRSFSQSEIITLTRFLDTSPSSLIFYFNEWIKFLQANQRVKVLNTLFQTPEYIFC